MSWSGKPVLTKRISYTTLILSAFTQVLSILFTAFIQLTQKQAQKQDFKNISSILKPN